MRKGNSYGLKAYEDAIRHTAAKHAPWYVVPADHKWFSRVVVARAVHSALDGLGLAFPTVGPAKKRELAKAREALVTERGKVRRKR